MTGTLSIILAVLIVIAIVATVATLIYVSFAGRKLRQAIETTGAAGADKEAAVARAMREGREEQANSLARFEETVSRNMANSREALQAGMKDNREALERGLKDNRGAVEAGLKENRDTTEKRLQALQQQNEQKLEQMRQTVDEKLTKTVEERFAASFKLIGDQLTQVQKGLGEMQTVAKNVGDLNRVLAGVKTRGNLGEYQLGAILEEVLSPEQYVVNAQVRKRSQERVEFAIKLPGRQGADGDGGEPVLLPIDSKFPMEDYERLLAAYDASDNAAVDALTKSLGASIQQFARTIRDKYINPPATTDFAILFVPTEGLYAEVLRQPDLFSKLQNEYHVTVVGPTNLVAFLSSLQMGFQTLAIEKHSGEIRKTLGAVKTQFGQFEGLLEKVRKNLESAASNLDRVSSKTNNINRKLGKVSELPVGESTALLEESEDA
ncbi:MAG: DNA recombination protein RmuC [Coriobacteriales bacterium]|jgi:DNA recombination protein RmuC|nr:DNA recombination protein RmuC [Coriobacteriales bacterium]